MLTFERQGLIAVIAVSEDGAHVGQRLCANLPNATLYTSKPFATPSQIYTGSLKDFTGSLWENHAAIIFVMASGIAVRSVAPWVESKLSDPAVVVVDDAARFAISLLSGHEGHANRLAELASEILSCMPVVTTGTESHKRVIVGVGCRKGVSQETILKNIDEALATAQKSRADVYALATIDLKSNEPGIVEAARALGVPMRVISRSRIRFLQNSLSSSHTPSFVEENIGVAAVCEPAALLASHQNTLILPKQANSGVTIALTEDTCGVWE